MVKEFFTFDGTRKFVKSPQQRHVLRHLNLIQDLALCFLKIHLETILIFLFTSLKWSLRFSFSDEHIVGVSVLCMLRVPPILSP